MQSSWSRQLQVVAALFIIATMTSGCGKVSQLLQKHSGPRTQLAVIIPIPATSGLHAESFMDDITLTTVVVNLKQGTTTLEQSAGISGNTAQVYFNNVLPGAWQVTATLRDKDNYDIFTGTKTASVTATGTAIQLDLVPVSGTLDVEVAKPTSVSIASGEAVLISPQGQSVTRALSVGATNLTTSFTNVTPAFAPLRVKLFGNDGTILASGEQPVHVLPGRTTTARVAVTTNGSLAISTKMTPPPPAPTGVVATYIENTGQVTVTWQAVAATGIAGYTLYRADSLTGTKMRVSNGLVLQNTFTDTSVVSKKSYFYWLVSESASGLTSGFSAAADVYTAAPSKIAFTSNRDGNYEIYVMNSTGNNVVRLTNNSKSDTDPAWAPNRTKIVFVSDRDGSDTEIYIMNADGTNQVRLTNNSADDYSPAWSPDGSKIAFYSDRDGNDEIYVMNSDGSNQMRLTSNSKTDLYPDWSPDGSKIVFQSNRDGNYEIYVMNPNGSNQVRLTNTSADEFFPAWSPDGSKIAVQSDRYIHVMNVDGTNQVRLTNSNRDFDPDWSPDGNKIVFYSDRASLYNYEIYVMNADGSNQTPLTNSSGFDYIPAWSPF